MLPLRASVSALCFHMHVLCFASQLTNHTQACAQALCLVPNCSRPGVWFRVAISLNCEAPGGSSNTQRIVLRQLDTMARLRGNEDTDTATERTRNFWRQALEVHASHSRPDMPAGIADIDDVPDAMGCSGLWVPRWQLHCRRETQLQQLCLRFTTLCTTYLTQVSIFTEDPSCTHLRGHCWKGVCRSVGHCRNST